MRLEKVVSKFDLVSLCFSDFRYHFSNYFRFWYLFLIASFASFIELDPVNKVIFLM